jgi:hypothetical protein
LQEEFGYINEAAEPLIAEALNITRRWEPPPPTAALV